MSAVPGQSRLWALAEDDDSRVLTWENFFLGGDTNAPVNAQIRLFANGDFTTRSNGVETVCRRVNPDDWDGDGLANEKDENPLVYDGDFFGVANAMPTNANLDAYYWLDVAAVGAFDFAPIRITCDGPSDLGDHVIIARTNQVCHVPLLAGATYTVESDLPIAYSAVSSEYAEIVTNAPTSLTVRLPVELSFGQIRMRSGSGSCDIFVSTESYTNDVVTLRTISSEERPMEVYMTADWNGGCKGHGTGGVRYYGKDITHPEVIGRMLMNGCGGSGRDITFGRIHGIWCSGNVKLDEDWHVGFAPVGFLDNTVSTRSPVHQ